MKRKKRITLVAVADNSPLFSQRDAHTVLAELQDLLDACDGPRTLEKQLNAATTVFHWEWPAPVDFSRSVDVLGAATWNEICMYLCTRYGDFRYRPRQNKPAHIMLGSDAALFQITLKV